MQFFMTGSSELLRYTTAAEMAISDRHATPWTDMVSENISPKELRRCERDYVH